MFLVVRLVTLLRSIRQNELLYRTGIFRTFRGRDRFARICLKLEKSELTSKLQGGWKRSSTGTKKARPLGRSRFCF
jgi:hypothetical protein